MRRILSVLCLLATAIWMYAAGGINYDGNSLSLNGEFTRSQCGTMAKKTMPETSGLAASRTTKGFLWAHGDENTGSNKKIVAVKPDGTLVMTLTFSGDPGRDDWEDIATGVYGGKNYVFLGAFGDNDLKFKDEYYIYYFEEPSIVSGSKTVEISYIRFGYPDNAAHNTETLMYDNIEQMFYIADKVKDGVCTLYRMPFRTDYGTSVQKLTKVTPLGNGGKFNFLTGGDITPDGKWMAIKSKKYVLLWERQGTESLSETVLRLPVQVNAYQEETQGESIAWANDSLFYTTSDAKEDTPIYQYARWGSSSPENPPVDTIPEKVDSTLKAIYEVVLSNSYNAYINDGETIIRGWYLAGENEPAVKSWRLSNGATWTQDKDYVIITALDGSKANYTLDIQPVTPVGFTAEEIVFDGTEGSWIKSAYGWASDKKWKFSKTDDDYSREIAGKTHVELFLPACDTVVLKSMNTERKVRFYVNGKAIGGETKLLVAGNTLVVNQSEAFMLSVVSAQSSGDGGLAAIRMARSVQTSIDKTNGTQEDSAKSKKIFKDGCLSICVNGTWYDATGRKIY